MANRGQMRFNMRANNGREGRDVRTTFQVARVTRPLMSVSKVCDAGMSMKFICIMAAIEDANGKEVRGAPIRQSMNYSNTEQVLVNDVVGGIDEAGVEAGIEGDLFGEIADTEAGGAKMGSGRGTEAHEDSAEEDCGTKRIAPDPGMPTQSEVDDHNVDHLPFR